jgi:hypothetical protein
MKCYLITTGLIFAVMTVLHVWRAIAEWPQHSSPSPSFVLGMIALIAIPGALAAWAFSLLRKK